MRRYRRSVRCSRPWARTALAALTFGATLIASTPGTVITGAVTAGSVRRSPFRPADDFEAASRAEQAAIQAVQQARARREQVEKQVGELDAALARIANRARGLMADPYG